MISKALFPVIAPFGMALLAGAFVSIQAGANSSLGRALGHPLWAAVVSLLVSTTVLLIIVAFMRIPLPMVRVLSNAPWWLWIGGIAGILYLASAVFLPSRIGTSSFILWVIAGQMMASLLIDHFGLLGMQPRPITLLRLTGVLLVIIGIVISQLGENGNPQA